MALNVRIGLAQQFRQQAHLGSAPMADERTAPVVVATMRGTSQSTTAPESVRSSRTMLPLLASMAFVCCVSAREASSGRTREGRERHKGSIF